MYSYFKKDTIFASDLYAIYYGSPCESHTNRPLILYLSLRDLRRMIPNFRRNYPLPSHERWLAARARVQQCWSARPNQCNFVVDTWEQEKCWTMSHQMFEGNHTSFNILQHDATWWPNENKILISTMLNNVESRRCIRVARALSPIPTKPSWKGMPSAASTAWCGTVYEVDQNIWNVLISRDLVPRRVRHVV